MACRKRNEVLASTQQKGIGRDEKPTSPLLD